MPSQKKKSYVSQDKECIRALTPGEREAHERYSFLRGKMTLQDCQMASEKALPFPVQLSTLTMAATTDLSIFVQNSNSFINTLNHLRSRQNCTVLQNTAQAYNCYLCESMWGPLVVPVYLLLWMPAFPCYWFSNLKQMKKHLRCTLVRNDKSSATKKEKNGERANFLLATSSRQINGQVHTSRRGALTISLLFLALISLKQRC